MSHQKREEDVFVEITPLDSPEDYNKLTEQELSDRYADVMGSFLSHAVNYSNRVKKSSEYLLKDVKELQSVANYTDMSDEAKKKEISLSRKLVEAEELCGTVLDKLVAFCITPGTIEGVKDKKLINILKLWKDSIGNLSSNNIPNSTVFVAGSQGLDIVFEQILERLFVDGDSVISEIWADNVEMNGDSYRLPYKINIHDTLLLEIDEAFFRTTGQEKIYINYNNVVPTYRPRLKVKDTRLPLFNEESNGFQFTTHLKLRPKTFSKWGTSYFKRTYNAVAGKKRIEALELNIVEGMINRITILLAGKIDPDTESGIVAPQRLAILESLISQPKTNNLILWPGDDLEVKDIGPNSDMLMYENKYKSENEKILSALGFPRVLVDGENSSTENWQKFLGIIATCEHIRTSHLVPWINNILRKIAVENGYKDEIPRWSFTRMRLYDLDQLLNAVKVFYDRGLMSELTALASGDLDHELESNRRAYESEFGMVNNYGIPELAFTKNSADGNDKEGLKSPDKDIGQPDKSKLKASIDDASRKDLVDTFGIYLEELHNYYTRKLTAAVRDQKYDIIDALFIVYASQMKKDVRRQMNVLFAHELKGVQIGKRLLVAADQWITKFIDGYVIDMEKEVKSIVESNKKQRPSLVPDLVAGVMAAFKTKRLRLYSSSVYNKAKAAGEITARINNGEDRIKWQSALTDKTCEWCSSMHNSTLPMDVFFAEFPPHPDCECWGVSTKEEFTQDTPIKDKSSWGKIE